VTHSSVRLSVTVVICAKIATQHHQTTYHAYSPITLAPHVSAKLRPDNPQQAGIKIPRSEQ